MTIKTETMAIAAAVNALLQQGIDRKFKDVAAEKSRKLGTLQGSGWKVFFIFDKQDQFLHGALIIEVSDLGETSVFENL